MQSCNPTDSTAKNSPDNQTDSPEQNEEDTVLHQQPLYALKGPPELADYALSCGTAGHLGAAQQIEGGHNPNIPDQIIEDCRLVFQQGPKRSASGWAFADQVPDIFNLRLHSLPLGLQLLRNFLFEFLYAIPDFIRLTLVSFFGVRYFIFQAVLF